jgi:hypothetical protein
MSVIEKEVGTLIFDLSKQGIRLSVKQDNLMVDAPKGRVTSIVLGVLKERKPEIIRELKGVDGEFQFGKTAGLYRGAKLPNRIHLDEATKLYRKRGWVQIFSGPMNQNIYLVKNVRIQVPDSSIPRYTQREIEGLKNLTLDELKTLHEAKVLFRGTILS